MTGLMDGVLGPESVARFAAPILYVFLFVLVAGSFACLQSFVNAVRRREMKFLAQMALIQVFVMFFEAMFFYREVVRAMAPWLMEQAGIKLSLTMTLLLAAFGWIGVRAGTRVLFAHDGNATPLALISPAAVAAPEDS